MCLLHNPKKDPHHVREHLLGSTRHNALNPLVSTWLFNLNSWYRMHRVFTHT